MKTIDDLGLNNKTILIREDFNVPMESGNILHDGRIKAALPTINNIQKKYKNTKIILFSHLGRPTEGEFDSKYSLAPVADRLSQLLNQSIGFISDWSNGIDWQNNKIVLCENVRFLSGEKSNNLGLAKSMADLCDVFVMDAFAASHRAHASTTGITQFAKEACAGPLLLKELEALASATQNSTPPVLAIVGGAKVSTKLGVLENLINKVDTLIIGGGIANTFLASQGYEIGQSLYEPDLLDQARDIFCDKIPLPIDVRVAQEFSKSAKCEIKAINKINKSDLILDIGPETEKLYKQIILKSKTILWNGPVGVFEFENFSNGTKAIGEAVAESSGYSLAGGGDTVSAIDTFNLKNNISYISTGGGAFLEFIEGKNLPAVLALENKE